MNIGNAFAILLAIVALAIGAWLGLFDLSLMPLVGNALVAAVFAYVGVMLGRRSRTANSYADLIQARLREAEAKVREAEDKLREHGISLPR